MTFLFLCLAGGYIAGTIYSENYRRNAPGTLSADELYDRVLEQFLNGSLMAVLLMTLGNLSLAALELLD